MKVLAFMARMKQPTGQLIGCCAISYRVHAKEMRIRWVNGWNFNRFRCFLTADC